MLRKYEITRNKNIMTKAGLTYKLIDSEETRRTAMRSAIVSLGFDKTPLTKAAINNKCFELFFFTLDFNKSSGMTKPSSLVRRLKNDMKCEELMSYNPISDLVVFTEKGKSLLLKSKRVAVTVNAIAESVKRVHATKLKALQDKCSFKGRKSVLTKADSKKVSFMLFNHLSIA